MDHIEMRAVLRDYFAAMETLRPGKLEEAKEALMGFFTDDYICRQNDWAMIRTKEAWVKHLVTEHPRYRWKLYCEYPAGYMIIDERKGIAICHIRQEVYNCYTNELVSTCTNNIHIQFKEVDGKPKLHREFHCRIPQLFSSDSPIAGDQSVPCWLYADYRNIGSTIALPNRSQY